LKEVSKSPYIENPDNIFAHILNALDGCVSRSLVGEVGNYVFSIWLREENMTERRGKVMFKPDTLYWPSDVNIKGKDKKRFNVSGFSLDETASSEFTDFNRDIQKTLREFVRGANGLFTGVDDIVVTTEVSTINEWQDSYLKNSEFERSYFPRAIAALKQIRPIAAEKENDGYLSAQQAAFDLVKEGIKEGGASYMPGVAAPAYDNLIFAAGYITGLAIRYEGWDKPDLVPASYQIAMSVFNTAIILILGDKVDQYIEGRLLSENPGLNHDRKTYSVGLKCGIENKLDANEVNKYLSPEPHDIRNWSIKHLEKKIA